MAFYSLGFPGHHKVCPHKQTWSFCIMLKCIVSSLDVVHPSMAQNPFQIQELSSLDPGHVGGWGLTSEPSLELVLQKWAASLKISPHPQNSRYGDMEAHLLCLYLRHLECPSYIQSTTWDQMQMYHSSVCLCPFQILCFLTSVVPKNTHNEAPV